MPQSNGVARSKFFYAGIKSMNFFGYPFFWRLIFSNVKFGHFLPSKFVGQHIPFFVLTFSDLQVYRQIGWMKFFEIDTSCCNNRKQLHFLIEFRKFGERHGPLWLPLAIPMQVLRKISYLSCPCIIIIKFKFREEAHRQLIILSACVNSKL